MFSLPNTSGTEALLQDNQNGLTPPEPVSTPHQRAHGPNGNTVVTVYGNGNLFANLPECDFISFLAIVQNLHVPFFDFEPDTSDSQRKGHRTHIVHLAGKKGIVFKSEPDVDENLSNKILISEILVLHHPVLSQHPNIHRLLGVTWQPKFHETTFLRVLPHLVFEESQNGALWDFMIKRRKESKPLSFLERLRFCSNIGDAIEAMHKLNIVHTDIKPENVLVFKNNRKRIAKVNDFGCTCFGAVETDFADLRGISVKWMAPEQEENQTGYTILGAKKVDIFSYGKVCAWLLFLQNSPEDIPESSESFDFELAMNTLLNGKEAQSGALSNSKFLNRVTPILRDFFDSSYSIHPETRAPLHVLSRKLTSILRIWELHYDESRAHYVKTTIMATDMSNSLQNRGRQFRTLLAKSYSLLLPKRNKAEFSIPGDLRMVVFSRNISETMVILLGVVLLAEVVVVLALFSTVKNKKGVGPSKWALMIAIPPFILGIGLCWSIWYNRSRYRMLFRTFVPFGHVSHLVPDLPELFPVLNRLHYLVRDEVVKGLIEKTRRDCHLCKSRAALQLALCRRTAFGKFEDDSNTYDHWIAMSGKKDVDELCEEIDFWEDRYVPKVDSLPALSSSPELFIIDLVDNMFYFKTLPTTISRYKEEIDGKAKAGVCMSSAVVLQRELGELYSTYYMYKDAELAFRKAKKMELGIESSSRIWRGFKHRKHIDYKSSGTEIADALEEQGNFGEAIDVLKSIPSVFSATTLREKFRLKKKRPTHNEWSSMLDLRTCLLGWLVAEGRLDEAMESGLIEVLQKGDSDYWEDCEDCPRFIRSALTKVNTLAKALVKRDRISDATELLRLSVVLHEKFYADYDDDDGSDDSDDSDDDDEAENATEAGGADVETNANINEVHVDGGETSQDKIDRSKYKKSGKDTRIWKSKHEYAIVLCLGSDSQIEEALAIQKDLLEDKTYAENDAETLSLLAAHSVALSRTGRREEAISIMDGVIQLKQAIFGDAHLVSLGFMVDLAGSLCLHGKEALEMPAKIQRELFEMAKDFSSKGAIQDRIIALLWVFSRADSMDEAIVKTRHLLDCLKSQYPGQFGAILKLKSYLAFILAHVGFTFEDQTNLNEALQLSDETIRETRASIGAQSTEFVEALHASAAIHSKKTKILCDVNGFGPEDHQSFKDSINAHKSALEAATAYHGGLHPTIADSRVRLAIVLSDVGIALHKEEYIFMSRTLFEDAIKSDETKRKNQAKYHQYALRISDDENITDTKLHSAFEKLRHWLLGDLKEVHPGDLALQQDLASILMQGEGHHHRSRRNLMRTIKKYHSLRRKWSTTPNLHPDVLRATCTYGELEYERDKPFEEVAYMRKLNWWATQLYRGDTQQPTHMQYRMDLAHALSTYKEYRPESVAIAREALDAMQSRFGREHTRRAAFTYDLASLLWKNGQKAEGIQQYREALDIYMAVLSPRHPMAINVGESLLKKLVAGADRRKLKKEISQILEDELSSKVRSSFKKKSSMESLEKTSFLFTASIQFLGLTNGFTEGCREEMKYILVKGKMSSTRIDVLLRLLSELKVTETSEATEHNGG